MLPTTISQMQFGLTTSRQIGFGVGRLMRLVLLAILALLVILALLALLVISSFPFFATNQHVANPNSSPTK